MRKHGIGQANENGDMFIDWCAANNMVIGETFSTQKNS